MSEEHVLEEEFAVKSERRRKLLPFWIKFFVWVFMIFGALVPLTFIAGLLLGQIDLSLYGFHTTNPYSAAGIIIICLFILKGVVAFSLWFEKDWAVKLASVDAALGIIICIASMLSVIGSSVEFRLEILFLIPYQYKLFKIKREWEAGE